MTVARTLEVTHGIDSVVWDVDSNVKATKALIEDNIKVIDHNLKATKDGAHFLSIFAHTLTLCFKTVTNDLKRSCSLILPSSTV